MVTKEDVMKDMRRVFDEKRGPAPTSGYSYDIANWHTETEKLWEYFCAGADYVGEVMMPIVNPSDVQIADTDKFCSAENHKWVSAKNEIVQNGSICTECHMIDSREPEELIKEQNDLINSRPGAM